MMNFPESGNLYPILFEPIYQRRLWGGTLLKRILDRPLPPTAPGEDPVGESWEVSDRDDAQSKVTNGPLAGCTLGELADHYGAALLGGHCPPGRFPLLVKLIDAGERLSLQVHPDEAYCRAAQDGSEPKTELWYILGCDPQGEILAGLSPRATRDQLGKMLTSPQAAELLQRFPSHPGDSYFIQAGTVHAIGGGNLILEIQQNSDTTFRISDWGRVGLDGKPRQLHLEQGLRAVSFANHVAPRIPAAVGETGFNRKLPLVERHCFTIDQLRLVEEYPEHTGGLSGSFHLLSVVRGAVSVALPGRDPVRLDVGMTGLVPAAAGAYRIVPEGRATVLKTYLK